MSRRKQDKPQQLKIPMAVPAAGEDAEELMEGDEPPSHCDLLQCGDCETTFMLSDIVKFIAHKRKCWKKEKDVVVTKSEPNKPDDDSQPLETVEAEKEVEEDEEVKKEGLVVAMATNTTTTTMSPLEAILRAEKPKMITPIKRTSSLSQSRDAPSPRAKETQTESIPDSHAAEKYICVSCKGLFEHAATLLKHAQEDHGMQIYTFPKEERPFSRSRSVSVESVSQADSLSPKSTTSSTSKQLIPKPVESSVPQIIHPPLAPIPVHSPHSHPVDGHTPPFPVLIRPTVPDTCRLYSPGMERLYPHINMHRREFHPIHPHESRIAELQQHISPVSIADYHGPRMPFPPPPPPPLPPQHLQPPHQPQHQPQTDSSAASRLKLLANKSPPLSPHRRLPYPGYPSRRFQSFMAKGKSCEFCGKTFKFQSNLVVHRRSHTGEKPFKCHLCDHACSQASKLKRHMKTHMNKPPSAMGSAPDMDDKDGNNSMEDDGHEGSMGMRDGKNMSDSSSPDEEEMEEEEEEEEDEEEKEEEEEEEEEEEPDEADMIDIKPKNLGKEEEEEKSEKSEGEVKSSEREFEDEEKAKQRRPSSTEIDHLKNMSRTSPKDASHHPSSLLCEMMVNSGLDEIQQYSEAFKQAIAERNIIFGKPRSSSDVSSPENHQPRNSNSRPPSRPHDHHSPIEAGLIARLRAEQILQANHHMAERNNLSDLELVTNRIKMEPVTSWPPSPLAIHREPLMSSPVRSDASPLGTPNGGPAAFFAQRHFMESNGAMSSNAILPYNSPPNRMKPHRSSDKRSDTCEFCGKQFKNCSNLTVHRRSHTGEKPYKCQLCSYACAQSSKLTRHMKTHGHGAKEVFKCEVCNMPFSVYSTLEKHMKKEHWGAIKGLAPRSEAMGSRMYSYKANLPGLSK